MELKRVNEVFAISDDNKVFQFGKNVIDLAAVGASNKKMVSDNKYYRINLYNKDLDTAPDDPMSPLPDDSGKQYLFNKKKTEFGTKAPFITNMVDASALPERDYGVIMGLSIRFSPMLSYKHLKVLDDINYQLVIKNSDNNQELTIPLLDINQVSSIDSPGTGHACVTSEAPTSLDPSRWIFWKPSTALDIYIEPENNEARKNLPSPLASAVEDQLRQRLMVKLHGMFTQTENLY